MRKEGLEASEAILGFGDFPGLGFRNSGLGVRDFGREEGTSKQGYK